MNGETMTVRKCDSTYWFLQISAYIPFAANFTLPATYPLGAG